MNLLIKNYQQMVKFVLKCNANPRSLFAEFVWMRKMKDLSMDIKIVFNTFCMI